MTYKVQIQNMFLISTGLQLIQNKINIIMQWQFKKYKLL